MFKFLSLLIRGRPFQWVPVSLPQVCIRFLLFVLLCLGLFLLTGATVSSAHFVLCPVDRHWIVDRHWLFHIRTQCITVFIDLELQGGISKKTKDTYLCRCARNGQMPLQRSHNMSHIDKEPAWLCHSHSSKEILLSKQLICLQFHFHNYFNFFCHHLKLFHSQKIFSICDYIWGFSILIFLLIIKIIHDQLFDFRKMSQTRANINIISLLICKAN
jgi:hypothetical protein